MPGSDLFSDEVPRRANRLLQETSPYLLQHAFNPVDWYPWGEEALDAARDLDRPIFLSVGYSACHWCHVMERESFENPEIAEFLNDHFVCIKVDREERPEIDQIYMAAVQIMTNRGGWPLSVFLTPDLKPFYGGTYWPPRNSRNQPGFPHIIERVWEAWSENRDAVLAGAEEITADLVKVSVPDGDSSPLGDGLIRSAVQKLIGLTDPRWGGYSGAPKFPHALDLRVMLRAWKRFGDGQALATARLTLDRMSEGGLYDHLGGGFHRYSTDERWLVPHFEKMLYDNALLVPAYLEGFQATGDGHYATVARETLDYVLREMTSREGGFFSAQDADSEGHEGKFFVWYDAEIDKTLGDPELATLFKRAYDVSPPGNWEGHNVLNRPRTDLELARIAGLDVNDLRARLDSARRTLYEAREHRIHPGRDDKVLVNWNGLMISAMAQAARTLGEERYAEAARSAADFLLTNLRQPDGRLYHSYKDGRATVNGLLDDYAALIEGMVDLYQAVFDARYLTAALELAATMIREFAEPGEPGFYYTGRGHERLVTRIKDCYDGSTPAGNSLAAVALIRLGRICGRDDLESHGEETLRYLSCVMDRMPAAAAQALIALDFLLGPTFEIAVVDVPSGGGAALLKVIEGRFIPNKVVVRRMADLSDDAIPSPLRPLLSDRPPVDGKPTAYVCQQKSCQPPVTTAAELETLLRRE